jgi:acylphosphatase
METRRVRLLIRGRVQGVAFRQNALIQATSLRVSGWIRNLQTGEVEALVDGPRKQVESLIAWCHRGPTGARVDAVEVQDVPADEPLGPFTVEATR